MNGTRRGIWIVGLIVLLGCVVMLLNEDRATRGRRNQVELRRGGDESVPTGQRTWLSSLQKTAEPTAPERVRNRPDVRGRGFYGETHKTLADYLPPPSTPRRVFTPTEGEGAPEDDWDDVSPEERVGRAMGQYEAALENAREASSEGVRDEFRQSAMEALSAVRADMVQVDGNLDRYAKLQDAIDD